MKTIRIYERAAGHFALMIHSGTERSLWRTGVPTKEEAIHRGEVIARELGYRLDKRVHRASAKPPRNRGGTMGGSDKSQTSGDVLAKGTTVKIVPASLKDKRREQLSEWLRKEGVVRRFLNGRYFVEFKDGTKWWLAADQVKPVAAKEEAEETPAEEEKPAEETPAEKPAKRRGRKNAEVT